MKENYKKKERAFTLIELLISLAIITTVSVVGLINLTGHREKLAVDLEIEKIVAYLRGARDRAITLQEDSSWGLRFVNNTATDDVYYLFKGLSFSSSAIVETRYFSKKTQLLVPPTGSTTDIIFIKGTGAVNASTTIVVQSKTRSVFFGAITINSLGQINY